MILKGNNNRGKKEGEKREKKNEKIGAGNLYTLRLTRIAIQL